MKKFTAILCALALVMTAALTGCNGNPGQNSGSGSGVNPGTNPGPGTSQPSGGEDSAAKDIAGTYQIDATPLGMPLQVYLTIQEDGTFQLTNRLEGGDDKGSGKVGRSGDTYMLVYSDSSADASKTSTFTVSGKQLVFSTQLYYGSASFAPNTEDPQNVLYPVAKAMAYTEYLGDYAGVLEEEVAAMGATLTYSCTLTLGYGAEYTFESLYTVMGSEQVYTQSGTFAIESGKLTLTPEEGEASEGTISEDKTIAIQSLVSNQGTTKKDLTLKPATTPDQAGTYTGVKAMNMGPMSMTISATLKLDKLGGYTYLAQMEGEEDYTESGTFTVNGSTLTFLSGAEGAEAVEGTLENGTLTCKFRISNDVPMATEIVFYADNIQGVFTAGSTSDAAAEGYASTLTLNPDGTYAIAVTKDGVETYTESGTFAASASPMGLAILLTNANGGMVSGVVSDNAINVNHSVDAAGTEIGFQYMK